MEGVGCAWMDEGHPSNRKGVREKENVECREEGITNLRNTGRRQDAAWPVCVARQSRVGRFLQVLSEPLEP